MFVSTTQSSWHQAQVKTLQGIPEENNPKFIKEYFNERLEQRTVQRMQQKTCKPKEEAKEFSSVFKTTFTHQHQADTCIDNGSDGNIADDHTVQAIVDAGADVEVKILKTPREFETAAHGPDGQKVELLCGKQALINTKLYVRHGSSLLLRKMKWIITTQKVGTPLLERLIQGVLGLNTRELLAAAASLFSKCVNAEKKF